MVTKCIPLLLAFMVLGFFWWRPAFAGPTHISGIITTNTTWTEAGSPYVLTGDTIVERDVTLTIDPGVIIRVDGPYRFEVIGSIRAVGTAERPILFTHNSEGQKWKGIVSLARGTAEFRHVTVEYAEVGITLHGLSADWKGTYVRDSLFQFNDLGLIDALSSQGPSILTTGNVIRYNKEGAISFVVEQTIIENNEGHGLVSGAARNSTIINNGGDGVHHGSVYSSVVAGNGGNGVRTGDIADSIIRDNGGHGHVQSGPRYTYIRNSSITGNGGFAVKVETGSDVNAHGNWWGTTDRDAIAEMLYDFSEDRLLGKVFFEPFLTASPATAGPGSTPSPPPPPPPAALTRTCTGHT